MNYTEIEAKVRTATNDEAWGPTGNAAAVHFGEAPPVEPKPIFLLHSDAVCLQMRNRTVFPS